MHSVKQTLFRFGLIGFVLWLLVAALTGNGRLADWAFIVTLLCGYLFLLFVNQKETNTNLSINRVSRAVSIENEKKKEQDIRLEIISAVMEKINENLSELQSSLTLILRGTYGKLSPGVAESIQQSLEKITLLEKTTAVDKPISEKIENSINAPQNPSIRNLKIS